MATKKGYTKVSKTAKYADGGSMARGGEVIIFKVGDKVVFEKNGIFGWEDIDEAEHGGYNMHGGQPFEVTEVDYLKGEEGIKLNHDEQWLHPNHFKLVDKKSKGGSMARGGEVNGYYSSIHDFIERNNLEAEANKDPQSIKNIENFDNLVFKWKKGLFSTTAKIELRRSVDNDNSNKLFDEETD